MPPKKRKSLVERLEEQRLLWFILISILIHHTVLTVFFKPPTEPKEEPRYQIIELEDSPPDEKDAEAAAQVPVIPGFVVPADRPVPAEKKKAEAPPETAKEEPKKPEKKETPKEAETVPAEVIPTQGLHYVDIRSNESDKPPEKAKYFAPINSIVDKETRAENTNLDHDDGMSTPQQSDFMEDEKAGDADKEIAAHQLEEDKTVEQEKGNENKEAEAEEAQTPQPSSSTEEPKKQEAQAEVPEQKILVVPTPLTVDNAPEPSLEKTEDGEIIDPETGQPILSMSQFFNIKKKKQKKVEGSASAGDGAGKEMDLPWKEFEGLFGKQMAEEKKAFEEAKKSHQKGGFTKKIDKVMSQLENFTADVQPGNQTALNAAYHPFAEYITAFHRKLHPQWGDGYLASLYGMPPTHPHNNMDLVVKLEFVVNEDGTIDKVTVVKSSGDLAYDVAAIDAVYGGEPYPAPPEIIKSYNGKVYLRWGFYRNESQCGVWNAEPYIIPAPAAPKLKPKKPPKDVKPGS
jgi:TonB family protein